MSKAITPPVPLPDILEKCKERIRDYPVECNQHGKIKEQIQQLEKEIEK